MKCKLKANNERAKKFKAQSQALETIVSVGKVEK